MARLRLVSFLGLGRYDSGKRQYVYEETTHRWPDGRRGPPTPYICRSLAQFLEADEIAVLATEQAENAHGDGLAASLASANLPAAALLRMPIGATDDELWRQFDIVKQCLRAQFGKAPMHAPNRLVT